MSHYAELKTQIKDEKALVAALVRMGFKEEHVEIHKEATNLYGYHGDKRNDKAEIIIRRKYIGGSSNDIGFKKQADGTYKAIISDFDRTSMGYNQKWLDKTGTYYNVEKSKIAAKHRGFKFKETTTKEGKLQLCLTK